MRYFTTFRSYGMWLKKKNWLLIAASTSASASYSLQTQETAPEVLAENAHQRGNLEVFLESAHKRTVQFSHILITITIFFFNFVK